MYGQLEKMFDTIAIVERISSPISSLKVIMANGKLRFTF